MRAVAIRARGAAFFVGGEGEGCEHIMIKFVRGDNDVVVEQKHLSTLFSHSRPSPIRGTSTSRTRRRRSSYPLVVIIAQNLIHKPPPPRPTPTLLVPPWRRRSGAARPASARSSLNAARGSHRAIPSIARALSLLPSRKAATARRCWRKGPWVAGVHRFWLARWLQPACHRAACAPQLHKRARARSQARWYTRPARPIVPRARPLVPPRGYRVEQADHRHEERLKVALGRHRAARSPVFPRRSPVARRSRRRGGGRWGRG